MTAVMANYFPAVWM